MDDMDDINDMERDREYEERHVDQASGPERIRQKPRSFQSKNRSTVAYCLESLWIQQ